MKKTSLAILLSFPVALFAQTGKFILSGSINNADKSAKAFLIYQSKTDSVQLTEGRFVFKGEVDGSVPAILLISHKGSNLNVSKRRADRLDIYLEESEMKLTASDSIKNAKVLNSKINDENSQLKNLLTRNVKTYNSTYAQYMSAPDSIKESPKYQSALQEKLSGIEKEKKNIQLDFINQNPGSVVSLFTLKDYAGAVPEGDTMLKIFSSLSKNIQESEMGKKFESQMKIASSLAIGKLAPDFILPDTAEKPLKLSVYKGKYVLIDFWASWCVPCRAENPNLVKSYNRFHKKGLEILGVSLDRDKASWLKAVHDDQLSWTHVSDLKYWKSDVTRLYQVNAVPQNYLISPEGKIIAKNLRGEKLNIALAAILGN